MRNRLRRHVLLPGLLAALLLGGCSAGPGRAGIVIGVSQCSDDVWREQQNREMARETAFYPGTELRFRSAGDDSEQQVRDIRGLMAEGVDLLVISPNEVGPLTPVVEEAAGRGIPVILIERKVATDRYATFVGADNDAIGRDAATYIAGLTGGRGTVVEVRGLSGSTSDAERHRGFREKLAEYPELQVTGEYFADWHQANAEAVMRRHLDGGAAMPDVVFAMNDRMAQGVYDAVSAFSGRRPAIVGIDALAGPGNGIEAVSSGRFAASFIYPTGGDRIVDLAIRILRGDTVARSYTLPSAVVDRSNARVIALQTGQIAEHQQKLERMNGLLDRSLARYANQQTLLMATVLILVLIFLLLVVAYVAYRAKSRSNRHLAARNDEIRRQAAVLAEQKEQLISQKEQLVALAHELEEATQAKLVFFTNISHELKTPLTLITGPVESLCGASNLTAPQRELLTMVKANSHRLRRLIDQIIEFRRYENGKTTMRLERRDLNACLRELLAPFRDYAARQGVTLTYMSDGDGFEACFDADKVEHIVTNLLSNAFKFTPRGGEVAVTLRSIVADGVRQAELTVYDSGKAIAPEQLGRIFDRFYKADPGGSGSGIGLALTRALVELHGGTIRAESAPARGTSFIVTLPFDQPGAEDASCAGETGGAATRSRTAGTSDPAQGSVTAAHSPAGGVPRCGMPGAGTAGSDHTCEGAGSAGTVADMQAGACEAARTRHILPAGLPESPADDTPADPDEFLRDGEEDGRPTVLLIEDNAEIRRYMALILGDTYRVLQAADGESGIAKALRYMPDLVVSDIMMPRRDGFEVCRTLKENLPTSHIPVVLLTACTLDEQRAEGFESGADAYIAKPFDAHILTIRLRKLIEGRERLREAFGDSLARERGQASGSPEQVFIDRLRRYVEEHIADPALGVDELGREVGLSRTQLYRKVKALTGRAPNELVRLVRLRRAMRLLASGAQNIAEAAYESGFASPSYFTRCFKEEFGESPTDYLRRARDAGRPGTTG